MQLVNKELLTEEPLIETVIIDVRHVEEDGIAKEEAERLLDGTICRLR